MVELTEFEKLMVGMPLSSLVETRPSGIECASCHNRLCVKYQLKEKYSNSYYYQCQNGACQSFAIEDEKTWSLMWFDVKGKKIIQ